MLGIIWSRVQHGGGKVLSEAESLVTLLMQQVREGAIDRTKITLTSEGLQKQMTEQRHYIETVLIVALKLCQIAIPSIATMSRLESRGGELDILRTRFTTGELMSLALDMSIPHNELPLMQTARDVSNALWEYALSHGTADQLIQKIRDLRPLA